MISTIDIIILVFSLIFLMLGIGQILCDIAEITEVKEMRRRDMFFDRQKDECCGMCKYHSSLAVTDGEFVCMNESSDYFSIETEWQDSCIDFERRDEEE